MRISEGFQSAGVDALDISLNTAASLFLMRSAIVPHWQYFIEFIIPSSAVAFKHGEETITTGANFIAISLIFPSLPGWRRHDEP